MMDKLSMVKMRIYCFIVNKNIYVRDAYQLPIDLNKDYHQKHRIQEWIRLVGLLLKYRILHRKPSDVELKELQEMQKKRIQLLNAQVGELLDSNDDAYRLRKDVTDAINELREADLIRFSERENIVIWGNGLEGNVPLLVRRITSHSDEFNRKYRFIWIKNKKKSSDISTFTTFYYPWLLMKESDYSTRASVSLKDEEQRILSRYDFLQQSVAMISKEFPQVDDTYARLVGHETYRYFSEVLGYLNPKLVLVWNDSASVSLITKGCCDEIGIPHMKISLDCFRLAYRLDLLNVSGDNVLTRYLGRTERLEEPSGEEIRLANNVIECLKARNANAWENKNEIISKIDVSRPIILLCGQNSINESGKYHDLSAEENCAHHFGSIHETVLYLNDICKENRWNLLYKHHLGDCGQGECPGVISHIIDVSEYEEELLIDICDVFISADNDWICSALVNKKPVISLRSSSVWGNECCYEVTERDKLCSVINSAIEYGVTDYQYERFLRQFACLYKYYFFSAYADIVYGQPIESMIKYLFYVMNETTML